jgi:hypothetical protein
MFRFDNMNFPLAARVSSTSFIKLSKLAISVSENKTLL